MAIAFDDSFDLRSPCDATGARGWGVVAKRIPEVTEVRVQEAARGAHRRLPTSTNLGVEMCQFELYNLNDNKLDLLECAC